MPMLDMKDKKLVEKEKSCPYCETGIGHFIGFNKHRNDIDDVEMGFADVYYTPRYRCSDCGRQWSDIF